MKAQGKRSLPVCENASLKPNLFEFSLPDIFVFVLFLSFLGCVPDHFGYQWNPYWLHGFIS